MYIPDFAVCYDNDGNIQAFLAYGEKPHTAAQFRHMRQAARHQAETFLAALRPDQLEQVKQDLASITADELDYIANICPTGWEEDKAWVRHIVSNWNKSPDKGQVTTVSKLALTFWARAAIKTMGLE